MIFWQNNWLKGHTKTVKRSDLHAPAPAVLHIEIEQSSIQCNSCTKRSKENHVHIHGSKLHDTLVQ